MTTIIKIMIVILTMFGLAQQVQASSLSEGGRTAQLVKDANNLCVALINSGWRKDSTFKSEAQITLSKILKKLGLDFEIGASAELHNTEYKGVFQKDLIKAILDGNACRIEALKMLIELELKMKKINKVTNPNKIRLGYDESGTLMGGFLTVNMPPNSDHPIHPTGCYFYVSTPNKTDSFPKDLHKYTLDQKFDLSSYGLFGVSLTVTTLEPEKACTFKVVGS